MKRIGKHNPFKWIEIAIEKGQEKDNIKMELIRFWKDFYEKYLKNLSNGTQDEEKTKSILNEDDSSMNQDDSTQIQEKSPHNEEDCTQNAKKTINKSIKKNQRGHTKSEQYKQEVFDILHNSKKSLPLSEDELKKIQMKIEDLTMLFDEESMFKTVPNIIKILIRPNQDNAKDYLRRKYLEMDQIELLSEFGQYTIEALIVHVLGMLFNNEESNTMIRVATLVEQLESSVRKQALFLKSRRSQIPLSMATDGLSNAKMSVKERKSKLVKLYPFGAGIVQFMEERGLITLTTDLSGTVRVQKKQGSYFLPSHLYAVCNFDISLLPIKLNLPMVCKPLDWTNASPQCQKRPRTLSDISGGYLSAPSGEMYDRYRLLSSGDLNNFYIDFGIDNNHEELCSVMNQLQRQPFVINSNWLKFLKNNDKYFVDNGYLMPELLASMNLQEVSTLLRSCHMQDEVINKLFSFSYLLNTLCKNIQRSRYERLIIKLANAYDGYQFYLPAFLDFRGRIYRCGVLHFHERDLARSMILFADSESSTNMTEIYIRILQSMAFHYQSFVSDDEAYIWSKKYISNLSCKKKVIEDARDARRPFQFLAHFIGYKYAYANLKARSILASFPITQDASASAYQIMSYFMLDNTMAKRTNLIPSVDDEIQDVYTFFLEELKEFMIAELENKNLSTIVCELLTRKLVKGIFMPLIYGKTLMSTARDLKDNLSHYITHKESFEVASVCFKFWRMKYQGMECLIRLIRNIGWVAAASDCPVFYKIPFYTTVQDYMKMEAINIWVYDQYHKKRRRVTLRVSSSKRDRRKTEISTFVNFIHQKDAQIAMNVVKKMLEANAPIYTVHDNFITTAQYCYYIPRIYSNIICDMGPPLKIINEFIYMNVIKPISKRESLGLTENDISYSVFLHEDLEYYLNANVPENISKKMRDTWGERIKVILASYENYTRNVCGGVFYNSKNQIPDGVQAHKEKWEQFKDQLKSKEGFPYYCVHY